MKKLMLALALGIFGLGSAIAQNLTIWTHYGEPELSWLRTEASSFGAAFGVEVEIVIVDFGEMQQQFLLSAPQGEGPDLLIGVPHDRIGELAQGGVAADMSSYATANYLDDLTEQARLAFTIGGRLFGLPQNVEGPALIVNRDLVPTLPASYDEMIEMAQDLTTADTFGFLYNINDFYFSYNWINTFGGFVFDRGPDGSLEPDDIGLLNEGAIAGAEAIKALRFEHDLIPAGTNYDVSNGLFIDGTLAMIYNGPWAIGQYRDAGINLSVHPMPPLADGTAWSGFMGVQGVVMNQFSQSKVNAANLAKWLTRSDAQLGLSAAASRIPASQSAVAQIADNPVIAGFGQALANAEPMPNIPEMGRVWGPMNNALAVITETPDSNVEGVLEAAVAEISGN